MSEMRLCLLAIHFQVFHLRSPDSDDYEDDN